MTEELYTNGRILKYQLKTRTFFNIQIINLFAWTGSWKLTTSKRYQTFLRSEEIGCSNWKYHWSRVFLQQSFPQLAKRCNENHTYWYIRTTNQFTKKKKKPIRIGTSTQHFLGNRTWKLGFLLTVNHQISQYLTKMRQRYGSTNNGRYGFTSNRSGFPQRETYRA